MSKTILETNYRVEKSEKTRGFEQIYLELELDRNTAPRLLERLQELVDHPRREIKVDLPKKSDSEWTVFFKLRENDTRAIVAHPSEFEWVGTLALRPEDLKEISIRLQETKSFQLSNWISLRRPNNFDFGIKFV